MIGRDVAGAVAVRVRLAPHAADVAANDIRDGIVNAMRAGDHEGPYAILGTLLWGIELLKSVTGIRMKVSRFWLGRLAARDPLMVAIRTVIGLYMPRSSMGSG